KSLRPYKTKAGKEMCYASLGDYNGDIDLTFFPKTWEKYGEEIAMDQVIAVKGKIDAPKQRDQPCFLVNEILDLEKMLKTVKKKAVKIPEGEKTEPEDAPQAGETPPITLSPYREVHIRLNQNAADREETLYPLRDYLFENSGPCSVFIHVPGSGGETVIRTTTQISAAGDENYMGALTHCAGVAEVWGE
ncbi:MAG: DNA polymerase III subunit alpha, partial [Spirochaetaceae bacterium]|nr:DNA polymerase III subunit alpha [Spirochaetaceae bacterium]